MKPSANPFLRPFGGRPLRMVFGSASMIIIAGCIAISYLSFNVWSYVDNLSVAKQGQQEYLSAQLEIEYLKLQDAIDDVEAGGEPYLDELRKRFDIFYSRTLPLRQGSGAGQFSPDLMKLKVVLDTQLPLIDGSDEKLLAGLDDLRRALYSVRTLPRSIGLDFMSFVAKNSEAERDRTVGLIEVLIVSVTAMIVIFMGLIIGLLRQAKSLQDATQAAASRDARLSATRRGALDGIIVCDRDAKIVDFSKSAEELFGHTRQEALGKKFYDLLLPPNEREIFLDAMKNYAQTGETTFADRGRIEINALHRDGHVFPAEVGSSLEDTETDFFFVCYMRDITEQEAQKAELVASRDNALSNSRERSRFFAMMSHEMRTPLNGILSALQMLEGSPLSKAQRSYLAAALTSGDILLGHINDVLAIERAEKSETPEPTPCDIATLTDSLVATLQHLARDNETVIELEQSQTQDRWFMTDPPGIQQIIVNLLSNAIKFTPGGAVKLALNYVPDTGTLHLDVTDTGIGIAEEDLHRIFEDFISLDSSYARRTSGTGLGLGIVQRFVNTMGGQITCASTLGEGTHFHVELPMVEASPEQLPKPEGQQPFESTQHKQHLLVVDDNEINRDLLGAMLERLGHEVSYAIGGQQAIDMAAETQFDAILMDVSMPEISGTQATRQIRSRPGINQNTHIIAVTAHALPSEREAFRAAGMNGFLAKPINLRELDRCLVAHEVCASSQIPSDQGADIPVLDDNQVADLLEVIGRDGYAARIEKLRAQLTTDLAALEDAQSVRDIQAHAHSMAGACGMLGAKRLHRLLQTIEAACKIGKADDARRQIENVPAAIKASLTAWDIVLKS